MKTAAILSGLVALASAGGTPTIREPPSKRSSLATVTVSGNAFWSGEDRFYLRGVDYQPGGSDANSDPLANTTVCKRDIKYFEDLGVNVIRVYTVDNSANHDECMAALADAGIYLVLDVNNSLYSLNRDDPKASYNAAYLQSVFATVQAFSNYTNTLAFFTGNEVINDSNSTDCAPYIKAVARDMKNYQNSRGLRQIPVGYSAADVSSNRMQTAHYMNCGPDSARSDFFAFNDYSWCNSNFVTSGWDEKVKNFTGYGIPIFLSEYGCITNRPRKFDELSALMSSEMDSVYSGGIMYEYSNDANDYGIVTIKDGSVTTLTDYPYFSTALSEYPAPTGRGNASTTSAAVSCPASNSAWPVNPTLLPEMPEQAEKYMTDGAGTGPGLTGAGSQDDTDSGTATTWVTAGDASATASGVQSDSTSSSGSDSGAGRQGPLELAPLAITGVAFVFTLLGALAL